MKAPYRIAPILAAVIVLAACGQPEEPAAVGAAAAVEPAAVEPVEIVLYETVNPIDILLPYLLDESSEPGSAVRRGQNHPNLRLVLGEPLAVLEDGVTAAIGDQTVDILVVRTLGGQVVGVPAAYFSDGLRLGTVTEETFRFSGPAATRVTNLSVPAGTVVGIHATENGFARISYRNPESLGLVPDTWILSASIDLTDDRVLEAILLTQYARIAAGASASSDAYLTNIARVLDYAGLAESAAARAIVEERIPRPQAQASSGESAGATESAAAAAFTAYESANLMTSKVYAAPGIVRAGASILDRPVADAAGSEPLVVATVSADRAVSVTGFGLYFDPDANLPRVFAAITEPAGWVAGDDLVIGY